MGRLCSDPNLKFIAGSGKAVCTFTIAVDRGLSKDKKEEYKNKGYATADFLKVKLWGKSAEFAANYTAKGLRVLVEGSMQTGSYDKNGVKVYTTEIMAQHVTPIDWPNSGGSSNTDFDSDGFQAIEDDGSIPF